MAAHEYALYGISLRSAWPLPCPELRGVGMPGVELVEGSPAFFSAARRVGDAEDESGAWVRYLPLPAGAEYLRWSKLFEFWVSPDGRRIVGRPLADASYEAFHTYLLGQVLSHSLIKLGVEPLHATVVETAGRAVGFLGHSTYGKSTLAAMFLGAGARLLTDDLLVVRDVDGRACAYPGVPRIKLFPDSAHALLGSEIDAVPMNPLTSKLVIRLQEDRFVDRPVHLRRLYALRGFGRQSGRTEITIRALSSRRAFIELLRNTYNSDVMDAGRLERQLLANAWLTASVPVKLLSFPRALAALPDVRAAVLADLATTDA